MRSVGRQGVITQRLRGCETTWRIMCAQSLSLAVNGILGSSANCRTHLRCENSYRKRYRKHISVDNWWSIFDINIAVIIVASHRRHCHRYFVCFHTLCVHELMLWQEHESSAFAVCRYTASCLYVRHIAIFPPLAYFSIQNNNNKNGTE